MVEDVMNYNIKERVLIEAKHIIKTHDTVRKTARIYGVSKSTVHHDVAYKLRYIDACLFKEMQKILQENFEEKHIRGGLATKERYMQEKENAI